MSSRTVTDLEAAQLLRCLRRAAMMPTENERLEKAVHFLTGLRRHELVFLLDRVGLGFWHPEKRKVVDKTREEWESNAPWWIERLPLDVHWQLLWRVSPNEYQEPPLPGRSPDAVMSAEESVERMKDRQENGKGLRRPDDVVWLQDRGKWTGSMLLFTGPKKKGPETIDEIAARKRSHKSTWHNSGKTNPDGDDAWPGRSWGWK